MENNALQVIDFEEYAMTPEKIRKQVNLIQQCMKEVMKEDEHYGIIPGCGNKPTLLKPGAEKLSTVFRLAPSYEIKQIELKNEHREYRFVCTLTHMSSGIIVSQGVGSCSTMESKFRFRKSEQVCPECGKETIIKGKKEFGGGWICYQKKGGCGAKFNDGDPKIENQMMGRIEHDNPADYYNTVFKIAKKRSHVDAVLTATAASDIFTQDIEDFKDNNISPQANQKNNIQEKKPTPEKQNKKEDKDMKTRGQLLEINAWLMEMGGQDKEVSKDLLKTITAYEDFEGFESLEDLEAVKTRNNKRFYAIYKKIENKYLEFLKTVNKSGHIPPFE